MFKNFNELEVVSSIIVRRPLQHHEDSECSYNSSFISECDDNSQEPAKVQKLNNRSGSYSFMISDNPACDQNVQNNKAYGNGLYDVKFSKNCIGKKIKKKSFISQSYNVFQVQSKQTMTEKETSDSSTEERQNFDVNNCDASSQSRTKYLENVQVYRQISEEEACGWVCDDKSLSSSCDESTPRNGSFPSKTNRSLPSSVQDSRMFHEPSIKFNRMSDHGIDANEKKSTTEEILNQSSSTESQVTLTTDARVNNDTIALRAHIGLDSGLGSGTGSVLTKSDSNNSTIESPDRNTIDKQIADGENLRKAKLFSSHIEKRTKNGVYIKSNQSLPENQACYNIDRQSTENIGLNKDGEHLRSVQHAGPKIQITSTRDLSVIEGKSLREASTNWILNKKSGENKSIYQRKRQALTKVRESLGSLLPYSNGSKFSRKNTEDIKNKTTMQNVNISKECPKRSKESHSSKLPTRWFQRLNAEDKEDQIICQTFWPKNLSSNAPETRKEIDYFLRARYNGMERHVKINKTCREKNTGNEKDCDDAMESSAPVHLLNYYSSGSTTNHQNNLFICQPHDVSDNSSDRKNAFNFSINAIPKKGILKKCSSIESGDLISETSSKRKRNVVTYDLPHSDLSLEFDGEYDSIENTDSNNDSKNINLSSESNVSDDPGDQELSTDIEERKAAQHSDQLQRLRALTYEDVQLADSAVNNQSNNHDVTWNCENFPMFYMNAKDNCVDDYYNKNSGAPCLKGRIDVAEISSLSSKGSICSTKASFDCIQPNMYLPNCSNDTKFDTIDNFKSQLGNPSHDSNGCSKDIIRKRRNSRFPSSIPVPLKNISLKDMNKTSNRKQSPDILSSDSSNQNTIIRRTKQQSSNKESFNLLSEIGNVQENGSPHFLPSTSNAAKNNHLVEFTTSTASIKSFDNRLEELDNYESYCLVQPSSTKLLNHNEDSTENYTKNVTGNRLTLTRSPTPQRHFRRTSVSN